MTGSVRCIFISPCPSLARLLPTNMQPGATSCRCPRPSKPLLLPKRPHLLYLEDQRLSPSCPAPSPIPCPPGQGPRLLPPCPLALHPPTGKGQVVSLAFEVSPCSLQCWIFRQQHITHTHTHTHFSRLTCVTAYYRVFLKLVTSWPIAMPAIQALRRSSNVGKTLSFNRH